MPPLPAAPPAPKGRGRQPEPETWRFPWSLRFHGREKMVAIPLNEKALKLRQQQERVAAEFEIPYRQYLDPSAELVCEPPEFARNPDIMTTLYRAMTLSRIFDAKAIALQRTGQLGTYPSSAGQEAIGVGYAAAMEARDVMLTTYREQPAQLW